MKGYKQSATGYRLPKLLSKKQIIEVLKHLDDPVTAMAIFLALFQGLRIGEMTKRRHDPEKALKWENINLETGEMMILDSKNTKRFRIGYGKDRIVPIFDEFIHVFKLWGKLNNDSKFVIPSGQNKFRPSSTRSIQEKLSEALKKSGLNEIEYFQSNGVPLYKYNFHTFRHICAVNLKRRGIELNDLKEFLGHEKLETTMVYLKMDKEDVKVAVTQAYAYPKKRNYYLPEKEDPNKAMLLRLENENLKLKNENLRIQLKLQLQPSVVAR